MALHEEEVGRDQDGVVALLLHLVLPAVPDPLVYATGVLCVEE